MYSLSLDAPCVNLQSTRLLRTLFIALVGSIFVLLAPFCALPSFAQSIKRYMVPGIPKDQKQLTAAFGYLNEGILRSKRTSDGRRYGSDEIAMLIHVLDEGEQDGLDGVEVVIDYRKTKTEITYATTIPYLREHGKRVLGVSGWELSMPRCMWSIDGAPPTGQPHSKPEQTVRQMPLFEFVEPRRKGEAY